MKYFFLKTYSFLSNCIPERFFSEGCLGSFFHNLPEWLLKKTFRSLDGVQSTSGHISNIIMAACHQAWKSLAEKIQLSHFFLKPMPWRVGNNNKKEGNLNLFPSWWERSTPGWTTTRLWKGEGKAFATIIKIKSTLSDFYVCLRSDLATFVYCPSMTPWYHLGKQP